MMRTRWARWLSSPAFWGALTLAIALLINLGDLRHPSDPLWDENYYLTSTQRYLEGRAQYASHPPLGLMLMAAGTRVAGRTDPARMHFAGALKKVRGEQIPADYDFFAVRFASALCGALAAAAFFGMMFWWTRRPRLAALTTIPILLDNALIVQFRSAQLDGPQVLFTVLALWAFLGALRHARGALFAFGICVGLSAMVRLNGALLGLLGIAILWADIRRDGWAWSRLWAGTAMFVAFLVTILIVMLVHVAITPHLPIFDEAGSKDLLYMTPRYQAWLQDGGRLSPRIFGDAVSGYWRFMMADLAGMARADANGSNPLLWPLGQKTITYRWAAGHGHTSYVQMVPNLPSWWAALAAVLLSLGHQTRRLLQSERRSETAEYATSSLSLWFVNFMAVNVVLSQTRVMYIYHYFMGLVAAYTVLALLIVRWLDTDKEDWFLRKRGVGTGIVAVICAYLALFPLTYNVRLSDNFCRSYNIFIPLVKCIWH